MTAVITPAIKAIVADYPVTGEIKCPEGWMGLPGWLFVFAFVFTDGASASVLVYFVSEKELQGIVFISRIFVKTFFIFF